MSLVRHLDLLWIDLLPSGVDAVGTASQEGEPFALLDPGVVAGDRVAHAVDLDERLRGLLRVLVVADRDITGLRRASDLADVDARVEDLAVVVDHHGDRKSTRLNSSH